VAAGPESAHVQVDEAHHDERKGGGGQPGAPVVHAEILEKEHGAPVVEGRLLKPGMAVEIGRDAGAELLLQIGCGVKPAEHLVGDLGVARFVCADQAHSVAAQIGCDAIKEKEDSEE
jgi:hypothetical protein